MGLLRKHWGFAVFVALSAFAFFRLFLQPLSAHYMIFTGAARALWAGQDPYGQYFGSKLGLWYYSPGCGLFFFGPFAALPDWVGVSLYMVASFGLFLWGMAAFARALSGEAPWKWHLLWLALASQMMGGIGSTKLEVAMTGILLGSCAWIIEGRRRLLAAVVLAMIASWKFQPIPTVGLIALSGLVARRDWKFPLVFAAALAGWFALPALALGAGRLFELHQTWGATFDPFVRKAYDNFDNIYSFFRNGAGWKLSYASAQAVGAGFAIGIAAWVARSGWMARGESAHARGVLLSVSLGAAFTAVFSPLNQNNGYILLAPLFLSAYVLRRNGPRAVWSWILGGVWLVLSLAYSDAIPREAREAIRHFTVKPLAVLGLALAVAWGVERERRHGAKRFPNPR